MNKPTPGHPPNTPIKPNMMQVFATKHPCFAFYSQILNDIRKNRTGNAYFPTPGEPVKITPAVALPRVMFQYFWDASFLDRNANNTKNLGNNLEEMFTPKPLPEKIMLFEIIYSGIGDLQIGLDARLEDWQAVLSFDPKGENLIHIVDEQLVEKLTDGLLR